MSFCYAHHWLNKTYLELFHTVVSVTHCWKQSSFGRFSRFSRLCDFGFGFVEVNKLWEFWPAGKWVEQILVQDVEQVRDVRGWTLKVGNVTWNAHANLGQESIVICCETRFIKFVTAYQNLWSCSFVQEVWHKAVIDIWFFRKGNVQQKFGHVAQLREFPACCVTWFALEHALTDFTHISSEPWQEPNVQTNRRSAAGAKQSRSLLLREKHLEINLPYLKIKANENHIVTVLGHALWWK